MTDSPSPVLQIVEATMRRRVFQAIWLIPMVVALIVGYLGVRSYMQHGPIDQFLSASAEGLSVGQTSVNYKYVTLGTVDRIDPGRTI